jgi:cob(I)alamin adenosyltransferase
VKSKIYTKTGDKGETSLVSGSRVPKSDSRINLYGEVDELNSRIGVVVSHINGNQLFTKVEKLLIKIQNVLFDLGSNLACEEENRKNFKLPQISDEMILEIEEEMDWMDAHLYPLKTFILPGGSKVSSYVHLCRTCCRSVERKLWDFHQQTNEELPKNSLVFLNRLSDYFFVLAREINHELNIPDQLWEKGQ